MKHSVTLIIPTLNRSQFLKRALISVLNQTFVPEEIIVVDNGSNDKTYQMIGDSFKKIRYIYFEDKGVSKARNEGLKNANNELISRCHILTASTCRLPSQHLLTALSRAAKNLMFW